MPRMGGAALVSFLLPIIIPSLSSSKRLHRVVPRHRAVRRRRCDARRRRRAVSSSSCRLSSSCRPSSLSCCPLPLLCRLSPCCPSPTSCRPSPLLCRVVVLPVTFCVPWQPIRGIGPNKGTVASSMMYIWSECPWICKMGADGVNTTTSMTMMSSCRKYHGCAPLWMEVPHPTVA